MSNAVAELNVHLDGLPPSADQSAGVVRSVLSVSGTDQGNSVRDVAGFLRDLDANVEANCGRRLNEDFHGSFYVFEAPKESMSRITPDAIRDICLSQGKSVVTETKSPPREFELTLLAPDRKGILATVADTVLKRNVGILGTDAITFRTPKPAELEGPEGMIKICSLRMLLSVPESQYDETMEDLFDGLEYLEHRYHWYIQLEKRSPLKRESSNPPSVSFQYDSLCSPN